jgi:hypothetical protein
LISGIKFYKNRTAVGGAVEKGGVERRHSLLVVLFLLYVRRLVRATLKPSFSILH